MEPSTVEYLSYKREELIRTIERFDNGITNADVVGEENESDYLKYSHTVLIQVLLDFICHAIVKNEDEREKLLTEICKRLSKYQMTSKFLIMDKNNEVRVAVKQRLLLFLKQVCDEVVPDSEVDFNFVNFFENKLSTDLGCYYNKNFLQLAQIGHGGFGEVFKVESKITNDIYAVKAIEFNYKNDAHFLKVMREANNIAAVNHPNVVRYHSAWIEMFREGNRDASSRDNEVSKDNNGIVIKDKAHSPDNSGSTRESEGSDYVMFSDSAEMHNNGNWTVGSSIHTASDFSDSEGISSEYDDDGENNYSHCLNLVVRGTLYIQMEFCDCDLRFWLDERAKGNDLPFTMDVTEIFNNILKGVVHIHSKGIIHRDLKPQNIFYSRTSNTLKIGDFGLATLERYPVTASDSMSGVHSTDIGTKPYAAPEQIKSKKYDTKVDMYSLGIILIELMNICFTRMELINVIDEVKDGKITEEMKKFPNLANLATSLISDNPNNRKCAKDILNSFVKDSEGNLATCLISDNPKDWKWGEDISLFDKDAEYNMLNEGKKKIQQQENMLNEGKKKIQQQEKIIQEQNEIIKSLKAEIQQLHLVIARSQLSNIANK